MYVFYLITVDKLLKVQTHREVKRILSVRCIMKSKVLNLRFVNLKKSLPCSCLPISLPISPTEKINR